MNWNEMKIKETKLESLQVNKCACKFQCPLHDSYPEMLAALKLALKVMYENPDNNIDVITGCSTTVKQAIANAEGYWI